MTSTEMPDAQECKARAIRAMERLQGVGRDVNALSLLLQTAQVWATLATVSEPLEEVHGQVLDSTPSFPVLACPHGMQARIDTTGENLRYTWQPDCAQGCP